MNQNLLKGIFIVLVIVDHNDFSRSLFPAFLAGFGFHVMGFMMVPFLRQAMPPNRDFLHYLFRLYYPFFIMVTALSIVVAVLGPVGMGEQLRNWALSVYSGNFQILKKTTQMSLLWFLPSFLSMIALRTLIDHCASPLRAACIATLWLVHPFIGLVGPGIQDAVPLGLLPALYVLPLAYLGLDLQRRVFAPMGRLPALLLGTGLFVLVKAVQMHFGFRNEIGAIMVADYTQPLALLCNDLEAVTGVLMVMQFSRLSLGRLLEACGQYSLQVYLLHAFVALFVYKALLKFAAGTAPLVLFAVSFAATVLLTLPLAQFAATQNLVRRLLFPRSASELLQSLRHPFSTHIFPANPPTGKSPSQ